MEQEVKTAKRKKVLAAITGYVFGALISMWIAFLVCAITAIFADGFFIALFGWLSWFSCTIFLGQRLKWFFFNKCELSNRNDMNISSCGVKNTAFSTDVNGNQLSSSSPFHPCFDITNRYTSASIYYRDRYRDNNN